MGLKPRWIREERLRREMFVSWTLDLMNDFKGDKFRERKEELGMTSGFDNLAAERLLVLFTRKTVSVGDFSYGHVKLSLFGEHQRGGPA